MSEAARETDPVPAREAFDELGRLVLAEHSLSSVLQVVADLAAGVVPGTDEASLTLVEEAGPASVATTGPLARELDETQYAHADGPCLESATRRLVRRVDDAAADERWPSYLPWAVRRGLRSSLSLPVPGEGPTGAALNLYSRRPRAFDAAAERLAGTFAAYAGVTLANVRAFEHARRLAEQLETALASRAVIEQAKGVLMAGRGCSADEAFALLVELSQRSNRKLRDVAQGLVESVTRP